jgi:uncharacterized protein YcfJ
MKNRMIYCTGCLLVALASRTAIADDSGTSTYTYTNKDGQTVECTHEAARDSQGHPILGTLAGGAIGGFAGNQFGHGKGKTAATAAGVLGGAAIGHHLGKGDQSAPQDNCHAIDQSQQQQQPPPQQ